VLFVKKLRLTAHLWKFGDRAM